MPRPKLRGVKGTCWDWEEYGKAKPKVLLSRRFATKYDQQRNSKPTSPLDVTVHDGGWLVKSPFETTPIPHDHNGIRIGPDPDKDKAKEAEMRLNQEFSQRIRREVNGIVIPSILAKTRRFRDQLNLE